MVVEPPGSPGAGPARPRLPWTPCSRRAARLSATVSGRTRTDPASVTCSTRSVAARFNEGRHRRRGGGNRDRQVARLPACRPRAGRRTTASAPYCRRTPSTCRSNSPARTCPLVRDLLGDVKLGAGKGAGATTFRSAGRLLAAESQASLFEDDRTRGRSGPFWSGWRSTDDGSRSRTCQITPADDTVGGGPQRSRTSACGHAARTSRSASTSGLGAEGGRRRSCSWSTTISSSPTWRCGGRRRTTRSRRFCLRTSAWCSTRPTTWRTRRRRTSGSR